VLIRTFITIGACVAASFAATKELLWEPRAKIDVATVRVSQPAPPFHFVREDLTGQSPKLEVRDARGRLWSVKFGVESKAEVFATRLVWALGYYSDATHFVREGKIVGAGDLKRVRQHIDAAGRFQDARFEYRDPRCRFLEDATWSWQSNPFAGTRELGGLKIVVMLLSNWDHKDADDGDSNNGVIECPRGAARQRFYFVSDWGSSLGKWGRKFVHNEWNCEDFAEQTPEFVERVTTDGRLKFGFTSGRGADEFKADITVDDARWIVDRLSRISDIQMRTALKASGATAHEAEHFASALRMRITALEKAAKAGPRTIESRVNPIGR
jgi:hypothetical protein